MKRNIKILLNYPKYKAEFLRRLDNQVIRHSQEINIPYSESYWNMYTDIWLIKLLRITGHVTAFRINIPTPTYRCRVTNKGVCYYYWQQAYTILAVILYYLRIVIAIIFIIFLIWY